MSEFLYLLLCVGAVYPAGWLFNLIGQMLGSSPTALGWTDESSESEREGPFVHPALGTRGEPDWMRLDEATRFPTRANWYGELPIDIADDHAP